MAENNNTGLEVAQKTQKVWNTFEKGYNAVISIAQGNLVTNIFRVLALLFLTVGFFLIKKFFDDLAREQAARLTQAEKEKLEAYIRDLDRSSNDQEFDDENDV